MKPKKIFTVAFVLISLILYFTDISEAVEKEEKVIWKMATHAPEAIGYATQIREQLHPAIEKATNGGLALDWYWGGIMGDDEDWIAKIQIDQLQGGGFDGHGIVLICPEIAVLELPFLFKGVDEAMYVRNNLRQRIEGLFVKNGYNMLLLGDQGNEGFDEIYSTKRPIRTPEDLSKCRVLSWCGTVENRTISILGASPIPVNVPEIVTNIRSGVADVLFAPGMWYVGAQLYTITKYVIPWKLRYQPGCLAVSTKAWNRISEEYQKAILEKMPAIEDRINRYGWDSSKKCVKAMIEYGLQEIKLTPDEIDVFKKKTRPLWDKLAGKEYPRDLLDEILGYLEEYRLNKVGK